MKAISYMGVASVFRGGDEPKDEHGAYTNKATGTIDCEITVLRFQSFGAQNQVDTLPEISQHLIVSTRKNNAKRLD